MFAARLGDRFSPGDLDVRPDGHVVLFIAALSLVIGLVVAVLPALRWSRANLLVDLQTRRVGLPSIRRTGGLWWLIPSQVALGAVLLTGAGALVKTVTALKHEVDASAPERVWFADLEGVSMPSSPAARDAFNRTLVMHLLATPGVEAVGLATGRPLASNRRGPLRVEGMTRVPASRPVPWGPPPPPPPRGVRMAANLWIVSNNYVSPGFFDALTLPLVRGRDFTLADSPTSPRVAIVNETLASRAFGTSNPLGRRLAWAGSEVYDIEIVGVVRDLRSEDLRQPAPDGIFFPLAQIAPREALTPALTARPAPFDVTIVLRTAEGQRLQQAAVVQRLLALDSQLFVDRVWTFEDEANRTLSQERLLAWTGSGLGGIAVTLLVVGLYGSLAAAVVRSRRELAIRLALGARPGRLQLMVVSRGLTAVTLGLLAGIPLTYAFTRSIAKLLYGVQANDPLIVIAIAAIFLAATLAGTWLPSRRAAQVDPLTALRAE
jgi:predicted permease